MRLTHGVRTLAVVLATVGVAAAPAQAKFDNTTYPPLGSLHPVAHHSGGGSDDPLIAIGALAAAALLGGGVAAARRDTGRSAQIRVVSGS